MRLDGLHNDIKEVKFSIHEDMMTMKSEMTEKMRILKDDIYEKNGTIRETVAQFGDFLDDMVSENRSFKDTVVRLKDKTSDLENFRAETYREFVKETKESHERMHKDVASIQRQMNVDEIVRSLSQPMIKYDRSKEFKSFLEVQRYMFKVPNDRVNEL